MWNTKLYSVKLANFHFWIGSLGIVFYALSLYTAFFVQSLMWKQFTPDGVLAYPNFLETVTQIVPMYILRATGGTLYWIGVLVMIYNLWKTAVAGKFVANEPAEAPALEPKVIKGEYWHSVLERKPVLFTIVSLVVILVGGIVEMVPTFLVKSNVPTISSVKPYTPLELFGRDIYIREGCNTCHSQMVRPFRWETMRYGEYSKAGEFVYDHPFLWGSKRTGPDLHRVGGKYPDSWHYRHMYDPRSTSEGSLMPRYPWMYENYYDTSLLAGKIKALRTIGVPYEGGYEDARALEDLQKQAKKISDGLKAENLDNDPNLEIIALIAYLQRLGTDIKVEENVSQKE
jgi:cytochrome c oxidase cbb3-type subunit I/II